MISVLYVDDESALLEICKLVLERTGEFLVNTESSPRNALDILRGGGYDAVVSDYQMPEMDGIEFLKSLRKEHPVLPFIIFTGRGREEIAIAAFENGADFYIQKGGDPVAQFAELSHKIRKSVKQREAEQALRERETRFRSLIQNTSDIIRILDRDGRITYDSPAASRILGYPENYFIGKHPADFIHPEDRDRVTAALAQVVDKTNPGTPTEFRIRRADGEYVDVESTGMNLIGIKGVDGIVVTTRVITERKRAERLLRESEEKYRDLYDNAPNAYYSIGTNGHITQCNYQAGVILGISCEDLVGKKIAGFYADTDSGKEKARMIFAAFRNGKEIVNEELQMQRANGNLIWINLTVNAMRDASGAITGSRTIITDITQRKAMEDELRRKNEDLGIAFEELTAIEEELRQNTENLIQNQQLLKTSESSYRTLAENIPAIVYRLFAKEGSRMQFFNRMLTIKTGYVPEELEKKGVSPIVPLIHPEDRARVIRTVRAAVRNNTQFVEEYRMITKNGPVRHFIERGRPVFDAQGELEFIDGIINDISERKQAEQDLAESRRVLDTLIHNLPGMVYRCRNDRDWTMEFVSGGCADLTGYDPGDLVSNRTLSYGSLIALEDRQEIWNQVQDCIDSRKPFQLVYRITDRSGHIRWVWEQGRGVFSDAGELTALEGYITDISGHKRTEEALLMANRKLQLLSGITRHDIRNQLLTLRSAIDLIGRDCQDQKTQKLIGIARKAADTIEAQIEFTKEYEHLGMKEPRWQNVSEVFRHATLHFLMCDISLEMPADEYEIFADPLLEKVFHNLLDNSFRHGGDVTRISLSCHETDAGLRIFVQDNGRGVPDEDKTLIFEQNFGRNTGLGLFLSREILSITGISIAETGTFGNGARFEIMVPNGRYRFIHP
ncbi:MAG: sensory histidine kinase AtoS [Methanoregula sp. PtaU1.Bin006]|uniref:hybrid sensor histidine kinase/response regulator n=1 Tax=Methanoregula sp. PtaU1.Bin006 TaxID=1811681 RepID=UPI0009CF91BD|nr:PAS domain S-box protein [Methanoregula sp. PtaU1.Bin006]OPY35660.1 MAG: sensory histidine kinase AtoS [Methanoregula sp. PtaU1.Bin006]